MISLTHEEYDILLDEFLLRDDIKIMVRHVSPNNYVVLGRRCFETAFRSYDDYMFRNDNYSTTEQKLINIARAMLIGYQLGKDIKSGVSQRGIAANE